MYLKGTETELKFEILCAQMNFHQMMCTKTDRLFIFM